MTCRTNAPTVRNIEPKLLDLMLSLNVVREQVAPDPDLLVTEVEILL
ncbi:MAG: hypothetical protein H0W90_00650 [Actinobacteria bacterium]|nr:hypothetical protein [Actinomycetota bacterium]